MTTPIEPAKIYWNELNTPTSEQFGDVYFSNDDALAETHYVFIEGNYLYERFIQHTAATFIIGETGFGSGLNFLVVWQLFLQFKQQYPNHTLQHLHFVSIEKHPLLLKDLIAIHHHYPTLAKLTATLQAVWPTPQHGQHLMQLNSCTLDIYFGDIHEYADYLASTHILIDAWFFDGFAPDKNSDMWSASLFQQLYTFTQPQGTFSTFTAAGYVRRNLQSAGFIVTKRKGFGIKREMLIGIKQQPTIEC